MTGLMAVRVGAGGRVLAFEPQPEVFEELAANVSRWQSRPGIGPILLHAAALSDHSGVGHLCTPADFARNRGLSSLVDETEAADATGRLIEVPLKRLDAVVGDLERIGVLKVDVEGHELDVFRGASGLLCTRRIRDILFEEHRPVPTETTRLLTDAGYALFRVHQAFWGLAVTGITEDAVRLSWAWGPATYLATSDPDRALTRLRKRGWAVFGIGRF
jgi:FkbM family methyltransferase